MAREVSFVQLLFIITFISCSFSLQVFLFAVSVSVSAFVVLVFASLLLASLLSAFWSPRFGSSFVCCLSRLRLSRFCFGVRGFAICLPLLALLFRVSPFSHGS